MPSDELPYAAEAQMNISFDELDVLRRQYRKEVAAQGHATTQTRFTYAWGLVKSPQKAEQQEGVTLLRSVYQDDPARRRECLYYLALGHYKMGQYDEARRFNALLLEKEPNNLQAKSLDVLIEKGINQEGYIGMAIAGGAVALGALLIAGALKRSRK